MYTPEQEELLRRVDELARKEGSQNKAGKTIGVPGSTLSAMKNKNYKGNIDNVFEALSNYFGVKEEAALTYKEVGYVNTNISSQVYEIIRACQIKGGLAIACGDAGIGKTKAAKQFVKSNPTNSVLITVNPCITSVKALLKAIADRIGAIQERTINELWFSVANKLSDGMVIIFDEAQHLNIKNIEILRSLSDYFLDKGQTLGICFIGNLEAASKIGGKKAEFAQITNRTKQKKIYTVKQVTRDDIKKLFPLLENKDKELDLLLAIAQTPQGIRGVVNLFGNAYDNNNTTYAGLIAMAKHMDMQI